MKQGLTPADLFARLTPHQLAAVALRPAAPPAAPDQLAHLAEFNRTRAERGLRPVAPSWFHPKLRTPDGR